MAKLVILLACVAVFNAVSALECYSCDNEVCKKDQKDWEKRVCGKVADQNQEAACQKISYTDKDGKEVIERKCTIVPKSGDVPCSSIPAGVTDYKCPTCKSDLCNSASTVNFSLTAVAGIVLAFLGQKYLL